jgi:hypothetical protein
MTGAEWLLPLGRALFADAGLKRLLALNAPTAAINSRPTRSASSSWACG